MATKLEKMSSKLNAEFGDKIIDAMREKFGVEAENSFNIIDMRLQTTRVDGEELTPEQYAYLEAFSTGYGEAMNLVRAGL